MSMQEVRRRKICRTVFKEAWKIFRRVSMLKFSSVLKLAWRLVRSLTRIHFSKAVGVTFNNRQAVIKRLSQHNPKDITLSFQLEPDNSYDNNAIRIVATIKGKGAASIGYLSKESAAIVSPLLKAGRQAVVIFDSITGLDREKGLLGCNFSYAIL